MAFSVSIGPRYEKIVHFLIAVGRYENRSEVIRQAMRLLEKYEYEHGGLPRTERVAVMLSTYSEFTKLKMEKEQRRKTMRYINATPDDVAPLIEDLEEMLEAEQTSFGRRPPAREDKAE